MENTNILPQFLVALTHILHPVPSLEIPEFRPSDSLFINVSSLNDWLYVLNSDDQDINLMG